MQIHSRNKIIGYPVAVIRDFLRKAARQNASWNVLFLKEQLKLSDKGAETVLLKLKKHGYIKSHDSSNGIKYWDVTSEGRALSLASASKPILRSTADRKIKEFLKRVKEVNKSNCYIYKVKKVVVFGSYLSGKEKLSDIDLGIYLEPREKDPNKSVELQLKRAEELVAQGMRFSSTLDTLFLPMIEIQRYLKSRSKSLSLHFDDKVLERTKTKVIFEEI